MANSRRRSRGFTFIEGIVATLILVVAISAMFGSWSTCFQSSSKVAELTAAAEICQANLETAKVFGATNMPLGTYSSSTATATWTGAYIPASGWTSGATSYYTYGGAQLASSTTAGVFFSASVTITDSNVLLGTGSSYSIAPTTIRAVVVSVTNVSTGTVDFTMATNLVQGGL